MITALEDLHDLHDLHGPHDPHAPRGRTEAHPLGGIFERGAQLIAERGWCQGNGMLYFGSPEHPQAASLTGALLWAVTGCAYTYDAACRQVLAVLRERVDPGHTAPFSDWELLRAWNDTPSRTRAQTIALLVAARNHANQAPASRTV